MSDDTIPFNMNHHYDELFKEIPENEEEMRRGLTWLRDQLLQTEENDMSTQVQYMIQISTYARILNELDLSDEMISQASAILEKYQKKDHLIGLKIRAALNAIDRKNYSKGDDYLREAMEEIEMSKSAVAENLLDYALFHYGRLKFEQGFYKHALEQLLLCLEKRLAKGDLELISETEKAIQSCRDRIEKPD